jgi:hypothetical protein
VYPRAGRSLLEGGVYPRAGRGLLEGTFEWATSVGRGGYRGVGRALCARLSKMCLAFSFLQVLSGISPVDSGDPQGCPRQHLKRLNRTKYAITIYFREHGNRREFSLCSFSIFNVMQDILFVLTMAFKPKLGVSAGGMAHTRVSL